MAFVDRTTFFDKLTTGTKWDAGVAFKRTNALPIDANSVFSTLESAQEYIANGAAYPGQVIAVVLADKTDVYVINHLGDLQSIASSSSPMMFKDSESEMLAITGIEAGQQVFRTDTKTIWIFKGGDPSQISNWVESAAQNDTVWYGTQNKINFYALTQSQFDGIEPKDTNTLYFISDSGKIYRGDVDVTVSISTISEFPEVANAIRGRLYVNNTTLESKYTTDGTSWIIVSPGYITDGANWANGNDDKFATVGVIKQAISNAISAISYDKFVTKVTGGTENNIVSLTADGSIKDSGLKAGGAKLATNPDSNTLATEAGVADAIAWKTLE